MTVPLDDINGFRKQTDFPKATLEFKLRRAATGQGA